MQNKLKTIVDTISDQIQSDMDCLREEEHHPGFNADASDDKMKELRERIRKLRVLRQDAETILTGTNVS